MYKKNLSLIVIIAMTGYAGCSDRKPIVVEGPSGKSLGKEKVYTVHIIGKEWFWECAYPGADQKYGTKDDVFLNNTLVLPIDSTVELVVSSEIASKLTIPGMAVWLDIQPVEPTTKRLFVTQQSDLQVFQSGEVGDGFMKMAGLIYVVDEELYAQTLSEASVGENERINQFNSMFPR